MRSLTRISLIALPALLLGCPSSQMDDARALAANGQHEAAGDAFLRIARADPANLGAWDGAIEAFCEEEIRVGRCMEVLDLELDLLGTVERHRDALSEALEGRARARLAKGLVDAALEDLARAERAAPNRPDVLVTRARALVAKGDREGALEALYRAKKIDPDHAEADEVFGLVPKAPTPAAPAPDDRFGGPAAD